MKDILILIGLAFVLSKTHILPATLAEDMTSWAMYLTATARTTTHSVMI